MERGDYLKLQAEARSLRPSNGFAALHVLVDLAWIGLAIFLSLRGHWGFWFVGQVLLFASFWRCFSIMHTCVHSSFFTHRRWNSILGYLCSFFALVPFDQWKRNHLEHHSWVGARGRDPSLSTPAPDQVSPLMAKVFDFCWRFHIPVFGVFVSTMKTSTRAKGSGALPFGFLFLAASHLLAIFLMKGEYFRVFALPIFLYLFTADFLILSQHGLCGTERIASSDFPLPLYRHAEVTRELRFPDGIGPILFLNFDRHVVHHFFPNVPHYRLRDLKWRDPAAPSWWIWVVSTSKLPGKKVYLE